MSTFIYHTGSHRCPLCNGSTDCRSSMTSRTVHCRRANPHCPPHGWIHLGEDKHGFNYFIADDGTRNPAAERADKLIDAKIASDRAARSAAKSANKSSDAQQSRAPSKLDTFRESARELTDRERKAYAALLCVPKGIFDLFSIRIIDEDGSGKKALALPECKSDGSLVGITLRYPDGQKRNHGTRGLTISTNLITSAAESPATPIYLPEGASDTLALTAMGLLAVGRPSNVGGVPMLIDLFASRIPETTPIYVLGENDQKPNGFWPGRDGAERTARRLAVALKRPIFIAFPPVGLKDVREILQTNEGAIKQQAEKHPEYEDRSITLASLGHQFAEHCELKRETIVPEAAAVDLAHARQFPLGPPSVHDGTATAANISAVAEATGTTADALQSAINQPYCAADNPLPDRLIKYAPNETCPNPKCCRQRHEGKKLNRLCWFSCKAINCKYCSKRKREQYIETVKTHLHAYAAAHQTDNPDDERLDTVYFLRISKSDWPTLSRSLRSKKADHFRYEINSGEILIVTTKQPGGRFSDSVIKMSPEEAIDRLCSVIADESIPLRLKAFSPSRNWKLIRPKPREPQGWTVVGKRLNITKQQAWDVFEHHRINWKSVTNSDDPWWPLVAWQWTDQQARIAFDGTKTTEEALEIIDDDLRRGEVWTDFSPENLGFIDPTKPAQRTYESFIAEGFPPCSGASPNYS